MSSRIESITTRIVALPLEESIPHPFMGARTQKATLIVQVHTSDGCTGFGYAAIESTAFVGVVGSIVNELAVALKGQDPARRAFIYERMWSLTVDLLHEGASNLALAAIDFALWDIAGQQAGMPLWKMLGGFRDKVPAYASWTLWRHHSIDRLEKDSAAIVAQGYRAMKMRMGNRTLAEDMERARAVRRGAGPDAEIMVDALWGLSATDGVRMARALEEINCSWLEEPVREGDFAGLAQARAAQAVPIAAGERISRVAHLPTLIPVIDHAIIDVAHIGGITPWLKAAALLDMHNLPISAHSHGLVHMHLLASTRTGAWIEWMPWLDALFVDPPQPRDGWFHLGEKPGLGLTLDEAALQRYAVK